MRKALQRSTSDKMIGGICSGLGKYFNTDPLLFRALFILVLCVGGSGLLVYLILWIVIPEEKKDYFSSSKSFEERNSQTQNKKFEPDTESGSISVGLLLLSAGILFLINNLVPDFHFRKFWPIILIIVGGGLILGQRRPKTPKENINEPNNEKS